MQAISSGVFSPDDRSRFTDLMNGIYNHDWFMLAGDFDAYAKAQRDVDQIWSDPVSWYGKTIRNTARIWAGSRLTEHPPICDGNLESMMSQSPTSNGKNGQTPSELPLAEIEAIISGSHANPFAVLGTTQDEQRRK